MTIAAHIVSTTHHYLAQSLRLSAVAHPDDHFIVFTDENFTIEFAEEKNITPVVVSPAIRNSLSLYYWYNFKLPTLLKRYDAAVFISNSAVLSLRTKVPQFLFLQDILFLQPLPNPFRRFILKYFQRFAKKSAGIFTTEKYIAAAITEKYPAAAPKNLTIYHGLEDQYKAVSWEEKELLTNEFASGSDYFIFYVSDNTKQYIKIALKAFSIFKKWQKSSMQMILLLDNVERENVGAELRLYKFREEVKLIPMHDPEQTAKIIAAAHTLIYLPKFCTGENICLNAMQCEVPAIVPGMEDLRINFSDAVVYCEMTEASVAEKMLLLYKDEALKKSVIAAGEVLLQRYSAQKAAADLRAAIRFQSGS